MDLRGKVAVVTGSSRGIGKRIALTLARSGADIVLSARTAEPGQSKLPGTINETAEEVRALGVKALPVRADLTIRDDVRRLYQTALEHFGRVDVLVNNAAYIGKGMFESFLDTPAGFVGQASRRRSDCDDNFDSNDLAADDGAQERRNHQRDFGNRGR